MTKKKEEKELVVATTGFQVAEIDESMLALMDGDAENYVDDTNIEDIAIPRLTLLQSNSKPCKKSEAEYIKGAEEGDLFNTLTKEVFSGEDGVLFVPVKRRVVYIHWTDVDAGGGMIENFGEDPAKFMAVTPNEKGKRRTSETTEIVKTHEIFGYVYNQETKEYQQVIMGLAGTQEKKMKRLNALIRSLTSKKTGKILPEYAGLYRITTTPEKNDTNSWYTFEFAAAGFSLALPEVGALIYNQAKEFADSIKKGEVTVKYDDDVPADAGVDEETEDLM